MRNNNINYEEEIDLKKLCIFILRKWRKLLIAAAIGAVLLGAYRTVAWLTETPQPVLTADEIEETQAQIASNEKTISSNQSNIPLKEAELAELQEQKESYDQLLEASASVETVDAAYVSDILEFNKMIEDVSEQISSVTQSINSMNNEISSLEASNAELTAKLEETSTSRSVKDVFTGIILGALLGIFLMCAYAGVRWLLDGHLRDTEEMEARYRIPVLGILSASKAAENKSSRGGKIDRWIDRLEGTPETNAPQAYQIAAAKLELLCKDGRKLLFTGTVEKEKLQEAFDGVKACLSAGEFELLSAENPMYHPEAMREVDGAALVLVEAVGISRRKEIDALVEFLSLAEVTVVGAVVV